ncbi:flagellar basal body rod protein FlgB [candidate division WOR-3 bacterium]|nr:flagellar basal body rod protein FlgB [candidate division WOR-3 bacterium]
MKDIFGDIGFLALKKGLEVGALRHNVIAQNIANLSTPEYLAGEVVFEELLNLESKLPATLTHSAHLPTGRSQIERVKPFISSSGTVDIDREMVRLAKNSISWNTYTQLLSLKYKMLLSAIQRR